MVMLGCSFSKAGMMVLLNTSVCALLPPLPYVPQNVRVTGGPVTVALDSDETEDSDDPEGVGAADDVSMADATADVVAATTEAAVVPADDEPDEQAAVSRPMPASVAVTTLNLVERFIADLLEVRSRTVSPAQRRLRSIGGR